MRVAVLLAALLLAACRLRGVPEVAPARDPASADAAVPAYVPAPDLLRGEIFEPAPAKGSDRGAHERHGGHGGHEGHEGHDGHGGHGGHEGGGEAPP
jgi:hypothetical protein